MLIKPALIWLACHHARQTSLTIFWWSC